MNHFHFPVFTITTEVMPSFQRQRTHGTTRNAWHSYWHDQLELPILLGQEVATRRGGFGLCKCKCAANISTFDEAAFFQCGNG